jgi:hypothetical protein
MIGFRSCRDPLMPLVAGGERRLAVGCRERRWWCVQAVCCSLRSVGERLVLTVVPAWPASPCVWPVGEVGGVHPIPSGQRAVQTYVRAALVGRQRYELPRADTFRSCVVWWLVDRAAGVEGGDAVLAAFTGLLSGRSGDLGSVASDAAGHVEQAV